MVPCAREFSWNWRTWNSLQRIVRRLKARYVRKVTSTGLNIEVKRNLCAELSNATYFEGIHLHYINDNHALGHFVQYIGREVAGRFTGGDLSSSLTHQLASIYPPWEEDINGEVDPHLQVYILPVQQQIRKDDSL